MMNWLDDQRFSYHITFGIRKAGLKIEAKFVYNSTIWWKENWKLRGKIRNCEYWNRFHFSQFLKKFNSHAFGMAAARPYSVRIDFWETLLLDLPARFFVIILKFIITPILIKNLWNKFLETKKFFSKLDFHKSTSVRNNTSFYQKKSTHKSGYRQRKQNLTPTAWELRNT